MEVMIQCVDDHPIQTAAREETQFTGALASREMRNMRLIFIRFLVDPVNLVEDRIGLRYLFQWTTFFTRFRP